MEDFIIRRATAHDIERIAYLETVCFPTEPWTAEMIYDDIVENPRTFYLALEIEGKLEGYAGVWKILDEGHITNVALSPEHRGKSLGEALMASLIEETEKEGIESWTLEVRKSNFPAIGLYEKMGFRITGLRPGYYQDNGEDALIMWKETT